MCFDLLNENKSAKTWKHKVLFDIGQYGAIWIHMRKNTGDKQTLNHSLMKTLQFVGVDVSKLKFY